MTFLFENFFELTITGLALGSVYALVAMGYTMVYGVLQLINFAHSEVFMYGTFAVVWTLYFMGGTPQSSTGAIIGMLLVALVVAMLTSAGVALLLERFAYRPLLARGAPKLVTLISGSISSDSVATSRISGSSSTYSTRSNSITPLPEPARPLSR